MIFMIGRVQFIFPGLQTEKNKLVHPSLQVVVRLLPTNRDSAPLD